MANTIVPPPPYKTALLDNRGLMSPEWQKWFHVVFLRIGGLDAPSNSSIQGSVNSLNPTLTTLQASVNTLQTEIDGLGQGRDL